MWCLKILALALVAVAGYADADSKVVCYYNNRSFFREGQGKFDIPFLEPALQFCTHLIYGFAGINEVNHKLVPLNENFDITKANYLHITELKRRYPGLRVLLSVGGGQDVSGDGDEKNLKYRTILEAVENRLSFINAARDLIKHYNFDGLDLAWEFPENKPKKIRGKISSFFSGLKKKIVGESVIDEKAEEHKEQFTALVREIRNNFRHDGLLLTLSVLPNVNSSVYYDPRQLAPNLDFVSIQAFDFYTPERNPKEADYPAPLYDLIDRKVDENGDYQIRYWLSHGCPNSKLLMGIPTFGRAWKLTEDSGLTGVPPLPIDGPAEEGPYTKEPGLLSYPEICAKLANPQKLAVQSGTHLRKVNDPTKRYGTYAYRLPDKNEEGGVWVGFDDPDTAGNKAAYAKAKGLGGIAIFDITLDDFRGLCTGDKYPILRAAKYRL
ncbi:chitinase-like protein Idgf4 isoform X2 [Aethina tumida]|uniref:chitinase-like protein Idgf4 isoform X2 n=1 Tax=Aethina tumida TaxID=116153 RepID=UPI00096ADEF5|nr:chitinase-like protein Idgf4 isoform X2 [Aethina tumida]